MKLRNITESFRHYTVKHKRTGKTYRVTAMHDKSALEKARAQHGGTASRYTGTSTDEFEIVENVNEEEVTSGNRNIALHLPRGEMQVLKAEEKDYDRGMLVKLLDDGGYEMAYWYEKHVPFPVEIIVDGKSVKKDAEIVEMKFHPELTPGAEDKGMRFKVYDIEADIKDLKDKIAKLKESLNESLNKTEFVQELKKTIKIRDLKGDVVQKAYELYLKNVAMRPADAYEMATNYMDNMAFEAEKKNPYNSFGLKAYKTTEEGKDVYISVMKGKETGRFPSLADLKQHQQDIIRGIMKPITGDPLHYESLEESVGEFITEEEFDRLAEKKDACYHKVKSRYKVWPSAYASGALVQCRKKGAKNWGN